MPWKSHPRIGRIYRPLEFAIVSELNGIWLQLQRGKKADRWNDDMTAGEEQPTIEVTNVLRIRLIHTYIETPQAPEEVAEQQMLPARGQEFDRGPWSQRHG